MSTKIPTFDVLDRLMIAIEQAKAVPLTKKVVLDKDEIISLLHRLTDSIPSDMKHAQEIVKVENEILDESNRLAERTRRDAESQAKATISNANEQAKNTVDSANSQAQEALAQSKAQAAETLRSASDQANAILAEARNQANAIVTDAQNLAQKMVSESEIIARAQAEAREMLESTHHECEDYSMRVQGALNQMMEIADNGLARQLDSLRALRQEMNANQ